MREVIGMAKNEKQSRTCLGGVCCHVEGCMYHAQGNMCTASQIDVKNESALTKAETFCGTFSPINTWR